MIEKVRFYNYSVEDVRGISKYFREDKDTTDIKMIPCTGEESERSERMDPVYEHLKSPEEMKMLQKLLIYHLWNLQVSVKRFQ